MSPLSITYAGNRQIAVDCLQMLVEEDVQVQALLLPEHGDCNEQMHFLLPGIPVSVGRKIEVSLVAGSDYLISIHFPHLISQSIFTVPRIGALNLHPSYLPWNRGWHTATWAIMDNTPYGATLHWIDEGVDTGPIAFQQRVGVLDTDTANILYQRALAAEREVFAQAIVLMKNETLPCLPQRGAGTFHKKKDIESIRALTCDLLPEERNRRIRALTTNDPAEAPYFKNTCRSRQGALRARDP